MVLPAAKCARPLPCPLLSYGPRRRMQPGQSAPARRPKQSRHLDGLQTDVANKTGEPLLLVNGNRYRFDVVTGDKDVMSTPVQPTVRQTQHRWGEGFPCAQRTAENLGSIDK